MPEVILKQDVYKLGDRGDVVRVAAGYARNYLFPKQLAIPADKGSLKQLEAMRAAAARDAVRARGDAEKQLEALEGVTVRVVARASLNNQLYGSVTARDIAAKLSEMGIEIDRHRIELKAPLRMLGDYEVPIYIYKDLESTLTVEVRAEGREDEPLTQAEETDERLEFAPAAEGQAEGESAEGEAVAEAGTEDGEGEAASDGEADSAEEEAAGAEGESTDEKGAAAAEADAEPAAEATVEEAASDEESDADGPEDGVASEEGAEKKA